MILIGFLMAMAIIVPAHADVVKVEAHDRLGETDNTKVVVKTKLGRNNLENISWTEDFGSSNKIEQEPKEEDLESWKAPFNLRKYYPYYLSGYDYENRPVWFTEFGHWNLRKIVEDGEESMAEFDKFIQQLAHRMTKSIEERSKMTPDIPVPGVTIITDMEGYSLYQIAHIPTITYLLGIMRKQSDWISKHMGLAIDVNVNAVASNLINLIRPVLGGIMEKFEIYGTQRAKWQSQLLKYIPRDQLPERYGGNPDFKPIRVYG